MSHIYLLIFVSVYKYNTALKIHILSWRFISNVNIKNWTVKTSVELTTNVAHSTILHSFYFSIFHLLGHEKMKLHKMRTSGFCFYKQYIYIYTFFFVKVLRQTCNSRGDSIKIKDAVNRLMPTCRSAFLLN